MSFVSQIGIKTFVQLNLYQGIIYLLTGVTVVLLNKIQNT